MTRKNIALKVLGFVGAFALLLSFTTANALSTNTRANVLYTGTTGNGSLFVALDTTIDEPGCSIDRFDIPPNHPQLKNWLDIASTAMAGNIAVMVRTNGCYKNSNNGTYPTLDKTGNSWFHLVK